MREAVQGPPSAARHPRRAEERQMNRVPARCFQIVLTGYRRCGPCDNPVRWHGLLPTAAGRSYRVFSCEDHALGLEDRYPASPRLHEHGDLGLRSSYAPLSFEDDWAS
jgi:hypothetical protein